MYLPTGGLTRSTDIHFPWLPDTLRGDRAGSMGWQQQPTFDKRRLHCWLTLN